LLAGSTAGIILSFILFVIGFAFPQPYSVMNLSVLAAAAAITGLNNKTITKNFEIMLAAKLVNLRCSE